MTNHCLVKPGTIKNGYAKEPIVTNNSHRQAETANNQATGGTIDQEQSNNQKPSESTAETDSLVRFNAIGRLIKKSTKQTIKNNCLVKPRTIDQTNTRIITITINIK